MHKALNIYFGWLMVIVAGFFGLFSVADAQPRDAGQEVMYITQYTLASDARAVYGIFDLGNKPSLRLVMPTLQGGKLTLTLHGRHYHTPDPRTFSVIASFEDVTGTVFQQSPAVTFQATKQPTTPQWFKALDNLAGCYGSQTITMTVPQGTSVVNLMGDDATTASPNQLVGYVSRIELPGAERSQTSSNGLGPSTP